MAQYNNQLETILTWSFPSNHLVNISLNREIRLNESWPHSAKNPHFFFISFIGGVKTNENDFGKTYDFKNQNYTVKFGIEEVIGFANALKYASAGNLMAVFGGWQKFARNNNNTKSVSLYEIPPDPNGKMKIRGVGLSFSQQNPSAKLTVSLSADHAISMSEVLNKMAQRGIDYELDRVEKIVKSRNTSNAYVSQQTERRGFDSPPPDFQPPPTFNDTFNDPGLFQLNTSTGQQAPPAPQVNSQPNGFTSPPQNQFVFNPLDNGNINPFEDISNDFGNMMNNL